MNELATTKKVKPIGKTAKDSNALRGLCASLNSGFTAPGGASEAVQQEIRKAMRTPGITAPEGAGLPDAAAELPSKKPSVGIETIPSVPLPTTEARDEVMLHRPHAPVVATSDPDDCTVGCGDDGTTAYPELPSPEADATVNPRYRKVLFTGQLKSGKDHCALAAGYTILSLAAPLYGLLDMFFGIEEADKDAPGCRQFMQLVGTWGRGDITEHEPVNPTRALFARMIQVMAEHDAGLPFSDCVDWSSFGRNKNIWLDACIKRADKILAEDELARVAVVNGRFENEIKAFDEAGWARFHVMASPSTLNERRRKASVPPAALQHPSEILAVNLDRGSHVVAKKSNKPRINVIWSDDKVSRPSNKFYTVQEFRQTVTTNH